MILTLILALCFIFAILLMLYAAVALLQNTRFFQHYYPETEGCAGYHSYSFNKKSQIAKIILFPFISALIAWLCTISI